MIYKINFAKNVIFCLKSFLFFFLIDKIEHIKGVKMATKKTATKTTSKAKLNIDFEEKNQSKKTKQSSKRAQKRVEKSLKKVGFTAIILAVLFLIVGAGAGWVVTKIICKNDCFEMIGMDEISIEIGSSYVDQGVKIVAFGKDESESVSVETNLTKNADGSYTSNEEGTFYMIYKSSCFKYGQLFKVEKIRLISFVEASEPGERLD